MPNARNSSKFQHILYYRRYACRSGLCYRDNRPIVAFQCVISHSKMAVLQLAVLVLSHFVILAAGFAPQSVVDVASSDILRLFFALVANVIIMLGAASSVEFMVDDVLRLLLRRGVESFISSSEEEVMVKTSR